MKSRRVIVELELDTDRALEDLRSRAKWASSINFDAAVLQATANVIRQGRHHPGDLARASKARRVS